MKHLKCLLTLCILLIAGSFLTSTVSSQGSCCQLRGDADHSGTGPDISDLVYLVSYMFSGGDAPPCMEETDVDGSGSGPDISDLVYLVSYMFSGGPPPVECPASNAVFTDEYGAGVTYQAFAGSYLEAVQVSADSAYAGTQGLEIFIPGTDPWWSGGAFVDTSTDRSRDLTAYNALTFWAKASTSATLDVAGIGNDNTGTSLYMAEVNALPLTTSWQQFVIPIPLPEKLSDEAGLFYFAEGEGIEYQIWTDEIVFDSLTTITNPRPALSGNTFDVEIGATVAVGNQTVTFDVDGSDVVVSAMPGYFTFESSNSSVVSVGGDGTITAVGEGTATLTATLGPTAATGVITVNVSSATPEPTTPAPTPTISQDSVVALWSDVYTNHPVDTWSAVWDVADIEDYLIGSDSTKKYTNLSFAGIEFTTTTLDASSMTHFHMDVWTPDPTSAPAEFRVKLVDFGDDGVYSGPGTDDSEHELVFDENTMNTEEWVGIDVPLSAFTGLTGTSHLAQMIISGDPNTLYIDNIYFYESGAPVEPTEPAPTPTVPQDSVVALWSDVYTNHPVDTWSAVWDDASVEDFLVGSDSTKKYTNLAFAGIEFTTTTLDSSSMTHFHMDVWTPDPTGAPAVFKVKLVDFGADGAWGGGDDVEHELTLDESTMNTATWVGIDVPLTDFANLTTTGHLAQMIISGDPNTVYIDNIYFYEVSAPTTPTAPAPSPTLPSGDVISLFSDAYTNHAVDTWSADWDQADVADYLIGSDNTKLYTNLNYAGIEFTTTTVDASSMTHFHMDVWTPDPTDAPAVFKIKLVDFGADGAWGGGDDVEHEITLDEVTMDTGSWVSIELALADFINLTTTGHLAQLIISGDPNTMWVDNVYFHK